MAFVTFGCRPACAHPGVRGISGSGRVRLVSERGLFGAYLGSSVTIVMCRSWRHLDVTTSEFRAIQRSCANLSLFELSYSSWNTRIHVGIVPQRWRVWFVGWLSHQIDTMPRAITGNGELSQCYLEARISVEEVSSRPTVDLNWWWHSAHAFPRNCGRSRLYIEILENGKSWWYELVKTNWSSESVISLYDIRSPEMASRAMC